MWKRLNPTLKSVLLVQMFPLGTNNAGRFPPRDKFHRPLQDGLRWNLFFSLRFTSLFFSRYPSCKEFQEIAKLSLIKLLKHYPAILVAFFVVQFDFVLSGCLAQFGGLLCQDWIFFVDLIFFYTTLVRMISCLEALRNHNIRHFPSLHKIRCIIY